MDKQLNHIAFIMDGNGRWAKKKFLPRTVGHRAGTKNLKGIIDAAGKAGIKHLTFYAFSTENWKRPAEEVSALMDILVEFVERELQDLHQKGACIHHIGDISVFSDKVKKAIEKAEHLTKDNQEIHLHLALNYSGRNELVRAAKKMLADDLSPDEVTEEVMSSYLDTAGVPAPDLMIRTSGELRLSNFLLWQLAYTEFYFTDVLWPDFNAGELHKAIDAYLGRDRRFGGLSP